MDIFNLKTTNSLFESHVNEMLALWFAVNNMGPQANLLSLFCIKKYFRNKEWRRQKLIPLLINQLLILRWENLLVFLMRQWSLWPLQTHSYCRLIIEICITHLLLLLFIESRFTLIKSPFFLIKRFCLSVSFFNF